MPSTPQSTDHPGMGEVLGLGLDFPGKASALYITDLHCKCEVATLTTSHQADVQPALTSELTFGGQRATTSL